MKKIVSTADLGGAPFTKADMREVFNSEIWDVIEAILSAYDSDTEGLIISGCQVSAGSDFDITAGIVYLNGEFMRLPASTGNPFTSYIAPATPSEDSRTFADGSTNGLVETKAAEIVGSAPGSGQYITVSSLTSADGRRWSRSIKQAPGETLRVKKVEIGIWDMDATGSVTITGAEHGIPQGKIIDVRPFIYDDNAISATSNRTRLPLVGDGFTGGDGGYWYVETIDSGATDQIVLNRVTAGLFDGTAFDDSSNNRGFVLIYYEE